MPPRLRAHALAESAPLSQPRRQAPGGAQSRALAARVLVEVLEARRSLSDVLEQQLDANLAPRDRALVQEIASGVLRELPKLQAIAERLLPRPLADQDPAVGALLLVGLYQLEALRIPDHAAIGETVQAARLFARGWASGLLNALLRRFQRERATLTEGLDQHPAVTWGFPPWLIARLQSAWTAQWQEVLRASNERPPLGLRVNRLRTSRADYAARLAAAGITVRPIPHTEQGLVLDQRLPPTRLPGFGEGLFSVQDGAAQLAAPLLEIRTGQRVLDACAAPGGKTGHLAELGGPGLALTAVDRYERRIARVAENLERLGLSAELAVGDAANPQGAWGERRYPRILLDVPCSATGVIRRHPDIKWLRHPRDIPPLVETQARMLRALWSLLEPGGILLYVTCSLLPEENERQLQAFLSDTPDARERPITGVWGRSRSVGVQVLPGDQGMDGFYFARLERCAP